MFCENLHTMLENLDTPTSSATLIPRKALFGNPEKAFPEVSPDGTKIAFLAPHEGVLNVYVRTFGKNDDELVTSDKKRGIRQYLWQEDNQHILYLQDQDGDENWHLYQTDLKSKTTRDLTPFPDTQVEIIATHPRFPTEILVGINRRDPHFHDVYRINLETAEVALDTENPGDVAVWKEDTEFQIRIAHLVTPDGGALIRIRNSIKSPWREFISWGPDDIGGVVGFTPDNQSLLLISSINANAARLIEMNITTQKSNVVCQDPQYDVGGVMIHPRTRQLQAVEFVRARREWTLIDKSLTEDFETLKQIRQGDIAVSSQDLDSNHWIITVTLDNGPIHYYSYSRVEKKVSFLFSSRPLLEKYTLAQMTPVSFVARDGLTIHGYLTLPPHLPHKKLPLILLVHGGPWVRDVWGYHPEVQWMANRGYAVLQINYRGSTGYGKQFLNAGDREWGGKMQTDLVDGMNWAIKQGYADEKRICIYGGSYGGYATLAGVTFTPDLFACAVDLVGPSNLVTFVKSIPPYWEPMRATLVKRLGNVETEESFLMSRSPLFKASEIKTPLLIAQGANDPRVKMAESEQIVDAMKKNKKEVLYLLFPDEGHGFARPENRLKFYSAVEGFLAKYLGGQTESPSLEEDYSSLAK